MAHAFLQETQMKLNEMQLNALNFQQVIEGRVNQLNKDVDAQIFTPLMKLVKRIDTLEEKIKKKEAESSAEFARIIDEDRKRKQEAQMSKAQMSKNEGVFSRIKSEFSKRNPFRRKNSQRNRKSKKRHRRR
ncbi:MAG: hypothetical protein CMB64_05305 [Euryarchaeota archaeon]|nr:hypothetical protein [Euryarchaeota archaeon]|tara:strand:+ start:885 stop:1277 length:393 start_codon:yes stop_codon:yes gene_type:complete